MFSFILSVRCSALMRIIFERGNVFQVTPRMCQLHILRCHQRLTRPRDFSTMSQSQKLLRKFNVGVQNGAQLHNNSKWDCRIGLTHLEEIIKFVTSSSSKRLYSTVQTRQPRDELALKKSDLHLKNPKVLGILNIHDGSRVVMSVIHCRFFKTARGIAAEVERNPSLGERLQNFFGGSPKTKITFPEGVAFKDVDDARVGMAYARGLQEGREQKLTSKKFSYIAYFLCGALFGAVTIGAKQFLSPYVNKTVPVVKMNVTFDDVKGCAEAKEELWDIVKFLQNPQSFNEVGGNLPKGVLLTGPPGSGKTLLARAVAGEAKVPFFYASCSSFDEILVGEGARRVRALFTKAKEMAPCVIFLDELDSIGGKRTSKTFHPYADQTINQLLTEMDGFIRNSGVMVLGATNRHDVLDSALLRPGRFDTVIKVGLPNDNDRREILEYYLSKVNCADIDVGKIVRITESYSPASLENLINQAAIRAVASGSKVVTMAHMMESYERLQVGPTKKEPVIKEKSDLKKVAYHECGHALTNIFTEGSAPLFKVTIKQTTSTLGHALYMRKMVPNTTRTDYMNQIYTALGGRAAEEVMIGPESITSGCLSDMQGATNIARALVTNGLGPNSLVIHDPQEKYSNEYLSRVDEEVNKILAEAYEHVKALLSKHKDDVEKVANALVEKKTLSAEEVYSILGIPLPEDLKNINTEEKFSSSKVKETWDGGMLGVDGRLNEARINERVPVQRPLPAS